MQILCNCQSTNTLPYTEILPFQGSLKKSTDEDIRKLADSLLEIGQVTPFYIWRTNPDISEPNYALDGHRRLLAIQFIAQTYPEVLKQNYPVEYIVAPDIETAKRYLLEICSSYGKMTRKGLDQFLVDTPTINIEKLSLNIRAPNIKVDDVKERTHMKVKLRIPVEKYSQLIEALKPITWIEWL